MEEKTTNFNLSNSKKSIWINSIVLVLLVLFILFLLQAFLNVNEILCILIGSVLFCSIFKIMTFESNLLENIEKLQMKEKLNESEFKVLKNAKDQESKNLDECGDILPSTDDEIAFSYLVEHVDSLLLSYIIYLELYVNSDESSLTREEFILMKAKTMARKIFESLGMEEPKFDMFPISTMYMANKVFKDKDFLKYL